MIISYTRNSSEVMNMMDILRQSVNFQIIMNLERFLIGLVSDMFCWVGVYSY